MKKVRLDITTDGSGNATVQSEDKDLEGLLYAVQLIDGDFDDGVDLTLTSEDGNLANPLLTKADFNTDQMVYPRTLEHLNTTGGNLTTHTMPIVLGRLKAVIAQGGATKSGSVVAYIIPQ